MSETSKQAWINRTHCATVDQSCRTPIVYIIDDDVEMQKSLAWLFDTASLAVETYGSFAEFEGRIDLRSPGCLILDLQLVGENGVEVMERLAARRDFHLPVIILTGSGGVEAAVRCMKLGAIDFFEKPMKSDQLVARIRTAIEIDIHRCRQVQMIEGARRLIQSPSARERETVEFISCGLSSKQIASKLGLSIKTVSNHRSNAMAKVNASNAPELVRILSLASRETI